MNMNKEEFAMNASKALDNLDSGDTEALESLLTNIDTEGIEAKGKKSSKKQMKNEEQKNKTSKFSTGFKIQSPDAMSEQMLAEKNESAEKRKGDIADQKKKAEESLALQDIEIN